MLNRAQELFKKQERIKFYGRNSKRLFKRRVKLLNSAAKFSQSYLEGANTQTRIYLLDMLKNAYMKLKLEIMKTPLPEGLTEEILVQVQQNLASMASPYEVLHQEYKNLQLVEFDRLKENPDRIGQIHNALKSGPIVYSTLIEDDIFSKNSGAPFDYIEFSNHLEKLRSNPYGVESLVAIEAYLKNKNQGRMASYFTGRILSVKDMGDE